MQWSGFADSLKGIMLNLGKQSVDLLQDVAVL
jgi:hypothetical protein